MITESVGRHGINRREDVEKVQALLKRAGMDPGPIDQIAGPRTIAAITGFQQRFLTKPDGRVDKDGRTLARLQAAPLRSVDRREQSTRSLPNPPPVQNNKAQDWTGDSSRWSQSKKLASLEPGFRRKIEAVIATLRAEGFRPTIIFGWRSVAVQQQLMRQGRTKVRFSFHNAQTPQGRPNAWAVDLVDERWAWNEPDCHIFFRALGKAGKAQGLVWGGDWSGFRDWAHLQGRQNAELGQVKRESGL
jgi:peptidoglycan L-alanyl-D-glutamate endopeptidase CwlK